jgi:DUF4097 and DUF4098 domain-containing protein YvlB
MKVRGGLRSMVLLSAVVAALAGCHAGPAATGRFERTYSVTGPLRLELNNAAGDVAILPSSDDKVHIRAEVRASGFGFDNPQKRLDDTVSNPPVEQRGNTIRVGKDSSHLRNLAINYEIEVPHATEVNSNVVAGAQTIRGLKGPVKAKAVSGSIRVENIELDAQLSSASGTVSVSEIGSDVRVSSASGSATVTNVRGDVRINAIAGEIQIIKPAGRVEADTTSGSVDIQGARSDVKARAIAGKLTIQGDPGDGTYWDLKTVSGGVQLFVPESASFHLTAEALTGEIRADIPIVLEEQGKHSLRAHVGSGTGRVEIHTTSGEIRIRAAK